jgi:hypothetical protein
VHGLDQGHVCAGDGGRPRTAVRLDDVAVNGEGALTEEVQAGDRTEGAADEALDLGGSAGSG